MSRVYKKVFLVFNIISFEVINELILIDNLLIFIDVKLNNNFFLLDCFG